MTQTAQGIQNTELINLLKSITYVKQHKFLNFLT